MSEREVGQLGFEPRASRLSAERSYLAELLAPGERVPAYRRDSFKRIVSGSPEPPSSPYRGLTVHVPEPQDAAAVAVPQQSQHGENTEDDERALQLPGGEAGARGGDE